MVKIPQIINQWLQNTSMIIIIKKITLINDKNELAEEYKITIIINNRQWN